MSEKEIKEFVASLNEDNKQKLSVTVDTLMELIEKKRLRISIGGEDGQEIIEKINDLLNVHTKKTEVVEYPVDKINRIVWDIDSSIDAEVNVSHTKDKEINIGCTINFAGLEQAGLKLGRNLTAYDKRVYYAVSALYNAGNKTFSIPMIWRTMGMSGSNPKADESKKIYDSIVKMRFTALTINNTEEVKNYKYPLVTDTIYNSTLLSSEDAQCKINGNWTDKVIRITRKPILLDFAEGRKQLTTFPLEVWKTPLKKTDTNLKLEDYLLERIAGARPRTQATAKTTKKKQSALSNVILYETILEEIAPKDTTTRDARNSLKRRLPKTVGTLLSYYVSCGHIANYKADKDSVTVCFNVDNSKQC